jgi:hypothetical protein
VVVPKKQNVPPPSPSDACIRPQDAALPHAHVHRAGAVELDDVQRHRRRHLALLPPGVTNRGHGGRGVKGLDGRRRRRITRTVVLLLLLV